MSASINDAPWHTQTFHHCSSLTDAYVYVCEQPRVLIGSEEHGNQKGYYEDSIGCMQRKQLVNDFAKNSNGTTVGKNSKFNHL